MVFHILGWCHINYCTLYSVHILGKGTEPFYRSMQSVTIWYYLTNAYRTTFRNRVLALFNYFDDHPNDLYVVEKTIGIVCCTLHRETAILSEFFNKIPRSQ